MPAGPQRLPVFVERGAKRAFASAADWPGWARSGRDEASAIANLLAYAARYARVVAHAAGVAPLRIPDAGFKAVVSSRSDGGSGTDFGAISVPAPDEARPVSSVELERLTALLVAAWRALDAAARAAGSASLRTGPRGGGRQTAAIVDHVRDAEVAYVYRIGGRTDDLSGADPMAEVRHRALEALAARVRGDPVEMGRRTAPLWFPRYFVRRSAWHALDHAWEIEDRLPPKG